MSGDDAFRFDNPMLEPTEAQGQSVVEDPTDNSTGKAEPVPLRTQMRVGLVLESTMSDDDVASGTESALDVADLSSMLRGAARGFFKGGTTAERTMVQTFSVEDGDRVLDNQGLRSIIEHSLGFTLEDEHLQHLMLEIDGDSNGTVTLDEFRGWFQDLSAEPKTKQVYVDPHTMALRKMKAAKMLDPSGHFRQCWDLTQALLLFYVAFTVPYRVGFDVDACDGDGDSACVSSAAFLFDVCVDVYFMVPLLRQTSTNAFVVWAHTDAAFSYQRTVVLEQVDIFVNFRTAVLSSQGVVIISPDEVAKRYMRGWLPIDVMASFPFSYIVYFMDSVEHANSHKLLKVFRLLRLMKLLRLIRVKRILDRWEDELYSTDGLIMLLKLVFLVALCAHWLSCAWFFVGALPAELGPGETNDTLVGWVQANWPQYESMSKAELYYESFVWSGLAVLMVQGSELSADTAAWEKFLYVVAFLVGAVVMCVTALLSCYSFRFAYLDSLTS